MTLEIMKLRLVLCDAINNPYLKDKLWQYEGDAFIKKTEPLRIAILNVEDENVGEYWREWEKVLNGQKKPTVRPIENDPMRAFIEVTF